MLAAANRLRRRSDFQTAVRRGHRSAGPNVVAHLFFLDPPRAAPPQVGFVVSKAVGPATTRNLVKRRLRGLVRERFGVLPVDCLLVVRANPAAATASPAALGADLDRQVERLLRRSSRAGS
ncbi:MAG: ribonuclease P protein component [Sporichthyaceae bacterium]